MENKEMEKKEFCVVNFKKNVFSLFICGRYYRIFLFIVITLSEMIVDE